MSNAGVIKDDNCCCVVNPLDSINYPSMYLLSANNGIELLWSDIKGIVCGALIIYNCYGVGMLDAVVVD